MNAIISPELLALVHPCERIHSLNSPKSVDGNISFYVSHLLANNISLITKWIELNHQNLLNVEIRSRLDHDFHMNLASKSLFADYSDFKNGYFNFILEKLYLKFPKIIITISSLKIKESFLIGPLDNELGLTAGYLSLILDQMGHKDEIFVLGKKSSYIAKTIISASSQSTRRNSASNVALILIDRDMDLKTATRCNQGVLDVLYNLLSDGYKTWMVSDSQKMELKLDKYGLKNDVLELLNVLAGMDLKTGLSVLRYFLPFKT